MYICIYICVYIYMYIYMCIYIYVYIYKYKGNMMIHQCTWGFPITFEIHTLLQIPSRNVVVGSWIQTSADMEFWALRRTRLYAETSSGIASLGCIRHLCSTFTSSHTVHFPNLPWSSKQNKHSHTVPEPHLAFFSQATGIHILNGQVLQGGFTHRPGFWGATIVGVYSLFWDQPACGSPKKRTQMAGPRADHSTYRNELS